MSKPTICLLHSGELGTAIGKLVSQAGNRIVTSNEGRSSESVSNAQLAGFDSCPSVEEALGVSQFVFSVVPPIHAESIAKSVIRATQNRSTAFTYVDFNSISPMTAKTIASMFEGTLFQFVDASIHGQAKSLSEKGTLFLSGPDSDTIANLFDGQLRVRHLGPEVGAASTQKMLLGSLTKGTIALFLQAAMLAETTGQTNDFLQELEHFYPETWQFIARSLPTYPQHGKRRLGEVNEFEQCLQQSGLRKDLASAIRDTIELFEGVSDGNASSASDANEDIQRIVRDVVENQQPKRDIESDS